MNSPIDIETIIARRKQVWIKNARKTISIQERIATSVPWWLIIVSAGLFALSASHTAGVFSQLSDVGYAGPFVVEFALLWAAFARVNAKQDNLKISWMLRLLEILVFFMAVCANTIGATARITALSGIDSFSLGKIMTQFGALPIIVQAEILFVIPFGVFIPIGTWVMGEGLAQLFLMQRRSGGLLEEKWSVVEREELRRAFVAEFIGRGMSAQNARREAEKMSSALVGGQMRTIQSGEVPVILDAPKVSAAAVPTSVHSLSRTNNGQLTTGSADARLRVHSFIKDNPEAMDMSVRELGKAVGVSKSLAASVLAEYKNVESEQGDDQ